MIGRRKAKSQLGAASAPWYALSNERFGFLLFLAAALHGIILLGVQFSLPKPPRPTHTLDITLAQHSDEQAPKQADFIAQANQLGSGTSAKKRAPSTTEVAPFSANTDKPQSAKARPPSPLPTSTDVEAAPPVPAPPAPKAAPVTHSGNKPVLTTTQRKERKASVHKAQKSASTPQPESGNSTSLLARSLEIANLQAQLDFERQQYAKRPRVMRVTSASTVAQEDAVYLDNWRRRIVSIGNLHYPEKARRDKIYGILRLLVAIRADGSVQNIRILESSGHPILDDAAVRIVRLAAPFQPFPVEMRKRIDLLEVIRTWKFEKQARVY